MNRSVNDVLRGHEEVGEGALCSDALNFAPRKHSSVYTEKPNS